MYDQSKGKITLTTVTGTAMTTSISETAGRGATATDGTLRYQTIKVDGFNGDGKGTLIGPDGNEQDTESFLSSLRVFSNVENECRLKIKFFTEVSY